MTKKEFVNKYVSENYPNLHRELIDLIYGFKPLDANGYDYVDMGEAGKWATCNVGATAPEESGLYFQWGDTQGYTAEQVINGEKEFLLTDYKYADENFTDVLQPEDDAAHVHMGGDWRMPTTDEFVKLYDLCNISWGNYGESEYNGVLFTLKTDSSKQLFFPAAGYLNEEVSYDGYRTCVWTSSLYTDDPLKSLGLLGSDMDGFTFYGTDRYWGLSVRGILGVGE